jgi:hypothetical protein
MPATSGDVAGQRGALVLVRNDARRARRGDEAGPAGRDAAGAGGVDGVERARSER